uniref:galectin-8-like isoform X2 n=1 Tax=Myxine glutinosa TaxID=7769 RepID=UPI00358F7F6D
MEKFKEITTMTTRLQDRPLAMTIYGGLQEGHMIYMEGVVPDNATVFIINLQMGSHQRPPADAALHIAIRLEGKGYIVCNSKMQGRWGREEKRSSGPFVRGQAFNIGIIVASGEFQVISNDKPFIMFKQRICGEVDTLLLHGQYQLHCLSLRQIMNIPGMRSIPKNIRVGSVILIRATVKPHGNTFVVNFCDSKTGDIALHLNPRMQGKKLVRNALLRQAWGQEELAASEFPFCPGREFEVRVTCEADGYNVMINGKLSLRFKHRLLPISRVDQVALQGDIMLPYVEEHIPRECRRLTISKCKLLTCCLKRFLNIKQRK